MVTRSRFLVYFRFILARRPPTHHNRGVEPNPEVGGALQGDEGATMAKLWCDYERRGGGGGGHPFPFFIFARINPDLGRAKSLCRKNSDIGHEES